MTSITDLRGDNHPDRTQTTLALKEILKLYDFKDSEETKALIDTIQRIDAETVIGRAPTPGPVGFCQGTEIRIQFDESRLARNSLFRNRSLPPLAYPKKYKTNGKAYDKIQSQERRLNFCPPDDGARQA